MDKTLKKRFDDICEEYLIKFCENYELDYEKDAWVAGERGTFASVGDLFLDFFDVIKYSVDNNLKDYDELLRWYDHTLECHDLGLIYPNFQSWSKGCPHISNEELKPLKDLKNTLADLVKSYNEKNQF